MIYGYARVSTSGQSLEEQINTLTINGAESIEAEKFTGATTERPTFNTLLADLKTGDTLMVTKLDRLARNVVEGIQVIEDLFKKGVKVHVLNVGLLEDTTMGRFFLQTMLAVAELERSMIVERTQAGKAHAKANNPDFKEGRPKKYKKQLVEYALELKGQGHTYKEIEAKTGIPKMTVYRAMNKKKVESEL